MKVKKPLSAVILFGILLCAAAVYIFPIRSDRVPASAGYTPRTLVIDAGHGGIDGGAISDDGTKESDINLAIALRLDSIVRFCGQKTVMTRLDDSLKTDMISYSEHKDLESRAAMINNTANAVLISIHQNDYPTAQPKGAQVLYSSHEGSERLGKLLQANVETLAFTDQSGEVTVRISMDTTELAGKALVFLETLEMEKDGKYVPVAAHKDLGDDDQTIRILAAVKTGDRSRLPLWMSLLIGSALLLAALLKRKGLRKKGNYR